MYVQRNNEARSPNHCCSGNAINITYSECVLIASYPAGNGHAAYCYQWPVLLDHTFPHYFINGTTFGGMGLVLLLLLLLLLLTIYN
jgi:hypothetical protein